MLKSRLDKLEKKIRNKRKPGCVVIIYKTEDEIDAAKEKGKHLNAKNIVHFCIPDNKRD